MYKTTYSGSHGMLDLNVDFLYVDTEDWDLCKDFQDALKTVHALNDHVQRGMAIIQEFCGHFTKDESQYSICCKLLKNTGETIPIAVKRLLLALNRTLVQNAFVVEYMNSTVTEGQKK